MDFLKSFVPSPSTTVIGGIVCGLIGGLICLWCVFSSMGALQKLFWITIGLALLWYFGTHSLFYSSLATTAWIATNTMDMKDGKAFWNRYSRKCIHTLLPVRLRKYKCYNEDQKSPVIFVVNSLSHAKQFQDCLLSLLNQPNTKVVSYPKLGIKGQMLDLTESIVIPQSKGFEVFHLKCAEAIKRGESLIVFPEGKNMKTQKDWYQLADFQSGVFELAKKENVQIVPVIMEGFRSNQGILNRHGTLDIHFLNPILPQKHQTIDALKSTTRKTMNEKLSRIQSLHAGIVDM